MPAGFCCFPHRRQRKKRPWRHWRILLGVVRVLLRKITVPVHPAPVEICGKELFFKLHETIQMAKRLLQSAAVCLFAVVLCAGAAAAADVTAPRYLVPVGHTVGIKLFSKGVMVVKPPEGGTPAKACGLRTGDVIVQCGGNAVTSSEQFQSLLQSCGGSAELEVRRGGGRMTLNVEPKQNDRGVYCIGAWIRDSMAGIGTMTYYDPATATFGALGHGITDVDTAQLMPFSSGSILPSTVKAVKKGTAGAAGELRGDFELDVDLGSLYANTSGGVFGKLTGDYAPAQTQTLPVGHPAAGSATILSNVQGDRVEEYAVEILRASENGENGRDLVLSVTDPRLLELTGGIIQGMSGSPVLQDGKLVGAVTHVCVT